MKIKLLLLLCCTLVRAEATRERFDFPLQALQKNLTVIEKYKSSKNPAEIAQLDEALTGLRNPAFKLELLFEAYHDKYSEMEGLRELVKELEDEMGKQTDRNEHIKKLKEYALKSKKMNFLSKTIIYAEARRDEGRIQLIQKLEKSKWLKSPLIQKEIKEDTLKHPGELAIDRIKRRLGMIEWDSKSDDRDYLAEFAVKFIKENLNTPKDILKDNKKPKYDLKDLNGSMGLHKRRRMDRKLGMLMDATDGVFVLTNETTPEAYQDILKDPIAQGKYAKLPKAAKGKRHIFIPRGLFLEVNKSIDAFGRAKDFSEAENEWLPEMLFKSGKAESESEAKKMAHEIVSSWDGYEDPLKMAKNAYTRLLKERKGAKTSEKTVFDALSSAIEAQIGMKKKTDCKRLAAALDK